MNGYVYVMGSDQWPYVKIGYSKDPAKRLWFVQVGSPVRLRLLATYEGGQNLETALHRYFERHRTNGEWFDLGDSAVERVNAAVNLGLALLLARRDDRESGHYRTITAAVHPVTGRGFASEHPEWFQPWPDLATRFPPARSTEEGMRSFSGGTGEEEHHLPEIVPALHPVTGREFAPQHPEWFQLWPDLDARFPPARSAGGTR
ncbi:GIY-YIG nuclease family protein [Streptomyces sp. NPDC096040]|uniref:GIY-YIG nuclease family protein n=1 Tax=Streptomyces sp. NPDC096040 TaxID=3155541 RepID=UPI00331D7190